MRFIRAPLTGLLTLAFLAEAFADTPKCDPHKVKVEGAGNPSHFFNLLCPGGPAKGKVATDLTIHSDGSISDITVTGVDITPSDLADCASKAAIEFVRTLKVHSEAPACTAQMNVSFERK